MISSPHFYGDVIHEPVGQVRPGGPGRLDVHRQPGHARA